MNEVLAYSMGAAALFGVVAPNSGNQKILLKYGTEEQKRKWLVPLTEGTMESGFSMTEPDSAGSDPRSIKTTARRDGDQWVINGHKWFTSNGFARRLLHRHVPDGGRSGERQRPHDADHRAEGHARRPDRARHRDLGPAEATTARSPTRTCACRSRTSSARPAQATKLRRIASGPGASITA